jgi:hypothetical protein
MSNGSVTSDNTSSRNLSPTMDPAVAAGLQAGITYQAHHNMHHLGMNPSIPVDLDNGMVPEYLSNSWQQVRPRMDSIAGTALSARDDLQFITSNMAIMSKKPPGSISFTQTAIPLLTPPTSTPATITNSDPMNSHHQTGRNSCIDQALELITSLHTPTNASCAYTTATSNIDSDNDPTIDQILLTNRAAIASLQRILNCANCLTHEDRGVALACFLIAGKIISWYATALSMGTSTSATNSITKSSNTVGVLPAVPGPAGMAPSAIATPIFLGDYLLDASTSRSVRAGLILAELAEHMQPLLTRLVERLPGIPNVVGAAGDDVAVTTTAAQKVGNDGGGKGCYELNCALRERVRGIVEEARRVSRE